MQVRSIYGCFNSFEQVSVPLLRVCSDYIFVIPSFSLLQDSAAAQQSSDSSLSDYQPPVKRKYVLKNKANASFIAYNRGVFYFCHYLLHRRTTLCIYQHYVVLFFPHFYFSESIPEKLKEKGKTIESKVYVNVKKSF